MAKKDQITCELARKAVEIYLRLAYGGHSADRARAMFRAEDETPLSVWDVFSDETRSDPCLRVTPVIEPGQSLHRFSLRLGNRNYPFMKLVLQEHLVPGEYYFGVDTHDQMEIRPDLPDYEAFVQVRRFNSKLKKEIEQGFEEEGLPTLASVRRKQEVFQHDAPKAFRGALILVVDDEVEEARTLEHFLRLQGFDVARAQNGREALERLEVLDPVLIVLDYEMPEMDGLALIRELRSRKRTRKLPVLLTSASQMMSPDKSPADCFLAKPYDSQDLIRLVDRMIG